MSLAILHSRASCGIKAPSVTVETHISRGLPRFSIVGLPETIVKESKDRVRSAIINSQFRFPSQRITINLAPADLPKEGSRFDLPIALGILIATQQIPNNVDLYEFAGELALSGELRATKGMLPFALAARTSSRHIIIPYQNGSEAALASGVTILPAKHLLAVCAHVAGNTLLTPHQTLEFSHDHINLPDLVDVRGQLQAKRALEIAAAGGHSLLLYGPPGTGKSMLASRLPGILPALDETEAMETAAVFSISNIFNINVWRQRPFRTPHHSASSVALVGGGSPPKPGEISLAHHGILFLDELPEFDRKALDSLREPLETGCITISRAARQAEFPAKFQLIAAMNPCPCGYLGDKETACRCTFNQVHRYRSKISGPMLDRIDMHIEVPRLPQGLLTNLNLQGESSSIIRARVEKARKKQLTRSGQINNYLKGKQLEQVCFLDKKDSEMLELAIKQFGLSGRAYHKILRVTRTIADLADVDRIATEHLLEALSYRSFERQMTQHL